MSRQSLDATCAALLTLAAWTVAGTTLGQDQLAIRGGRIIPIVGKPIDNGVILVRDGKIAAVGKDLAIPIEASVIDATGKVILPGFVEAHSTSTMGQPNERNPNTPFVSVVDSIDPSRDYFEECRRNGVTTIAVVPGNDTMIGGQAAIIKTAGKYVEQMILKRTAGVKISLRPPSSASRMSHYAKLRKELEKASRQPQGGEKAKERRAEPKKKASDPDGKEEQNDDEQEKKEKPSDAESTEESGDEQAALKKVLHGKASAFIYCDNGMDVLQAIKLVKQYKLKAILVLGRDGYQAAEQIAENKLPVVLDHTLVFWRTDDRTGADEKIIVPQVFRQAGVPVTFQVSASSRGALGSGYLWHQAATAVKYGAPVDDSLKAITLRPAEVLGVDDFVGSIEPDKDADLVILSGNPLKVDTWVVTTIVNGRIVYEHNKDKKLRKLLQPNEK